MKQKFSKIGIAVRVLLVVACIAPMLVMTWGQGFYGSVVGTVTDGTGAIIPGASIILTNIGTNEKRSTQSDSAGSYSFVNLNPTNYRLEVERTGFKRLTREPITVQVEAAVRIDAALELGAVTETVKVTSQAPLLDTESASASQVVEGKLVQEMPLNGRNVVNLIALTPGIVQQGQNMGGTGLDKGGTSTGSSGWQNFQMAGGIAGMNAIFIDGAPDDTSHNNLALVPTQDGLQEFRVVTNDASVEYGRYMGGVVTMTTKSGTNSYHGSAYEYLRNADFNANTFFNNLNKQPRLQWNQNQYGATLGGKVVRDKLFFFFGWEGINIRTGSALTTFVPGDGNNGTANQRAGAFNQTVTFPSFIPGGTSAATGCYYYPTAGTTQINLSNTYTLNGVVTPCADPTALALMKYYYPGTNSSNSAYNYFSSVSVPENQSQYTARVDYRLSDKQQLFGKYANWHVTDLPATPFHNQVNSATADNNSQQFVLGDVYTFNPSTILDIHVSDMRNFHDGEPSNLGLDLSQFGTNWGTLQNQMTYKFNPWLTFSKNDMQNVGGGQYTAKFTYENVYDIAGDITKILGRHTVKVGGDFRLSDYDSLPQGNSGSFTFDTTFTNSDFAAFLLGIPTSGSIGTGIGVRTYDYYQGYYASDVWQAGRKLTLNLGVRWELPGGMSERKNRGVVLLPYTVDPVTGVTGTLAPLNSTLYPHRPTVMPKYDLFAPRVGFAYRFNEQTVLRAGYGISYLPNDVDGDLDPASSSLISNTTSFTNSVSSVANTLNNPWPTGFNQPLWSSAGTIPSNFMTNELGPKNNIAAPYPTEPFANVQQWNVSLGRQFAGDLMVEVGYVGSKGTHLYNVGGISGNNGYQSIDQLSPQYYSQGAALAALAPNAPSYFPASKWTVGQSLRPYPAYNNVYNLGDFTCCSTSYNSLQIKGEKRFHSGGEVMANYSWSKMMSNTEQFTTSTDYDIGFVQNYDNMKGEYSLLSTNVPQRLIASYVQPLPFGDGQRFANWHGFAGRLVSGWAVNGITTFQSGFPLALSSSVSSALTTNYGAGKIRPDFAPTGVTVQNGVTYTCNGKTLSGSIKSHILANTPVFNVGCFQNPGADTAGSSPTYSFGNEPRVDPTLHAQGIDNWDMSLLKSTKITERSDLKFRAEAFNIFNRTQFQPPAVSQAGKNFGIVTAQANNPRLLQLSLRLDF